MWRILTFRNSLWEPLLIHLLLIYLLVHMTEIYTGKKYHQLIITDLMNFMII